MVKWILPLRSVSNVGFTFVYCHKVFQNLDMR